METFFSASEARLVKPLPMLLPLCDRCGLFRDCQSPKMSPTGQGKRRFLIVGEAPGSNEDTDGIQLTGKMGRYLEGELDAVGIDMRRDCILTNASICYGAAQHKTSVNDCRPNLLKTIETYKPIAILLLGGAAVQSLIGHVWKPDTGPMARWTGWKIPCHKPNAWILPANNPAYLMRENHPVLGIELRRTLEQLTEITEPPWPDGPPDYESRVECIYDPDEAAERIRKYRDGVIAFDYETNTLKPDSSRAEIVCCSVCHNGTETISFPWVGAACRAMVGLLKDENVDKIGWNAKFEQRWTQRKMGVDVRGWVWDGMLAAHALDPRPGITGLKFQAFTRIGCRDYNSHLEPMLESNPKGGNNINRVREIKPSLLLSYCGVDALAEYLTAQHQMRELEHGASNVSEA